MLESLLSRNTANNANVARRSAALAPGVKLVELEFEFELGCPSAEPRLGPTAPLFSAGVCSAPSAVGEIRSAPELNSGVASANP